MKSSSNYLDYVPQLKKNVSYTADENSAVTLSVAHNGFFDRIAQKLFKRSAVTAIELEGQGNFILPLIDGNRTIYEIALAVREQFGEEAEPVFQRVSAFIGILKGNDIIEYKAK